MSNAAVALIRCDDYSGPKVAEAIERQFELLGGLDRFARPGDTVLLKPNFIAPRSRHNATQTDPAIVLELARLLKDFGAKPFVGDSPAWSNVFACVKALQMEDELKELGVPVKQLDKPKTCRIGIMNTRVGISSVALDADVIINLPKFKTHQQLVATFAVKNMFGCVAGKRKAIWHFAKGKREGDFCRMLIDIYRFVNPVVTIIDAVTVMDGPGPIRGRARPLGYLIGGMDPMSLERVCCKLVNIRPQDLPIVRTAKLIGFGPSDDEKIEVLGDELPQKPCMDFELPELIPIRFSFLHVCKSIGKQILLLTKSAAN
ncbi:MAG: DUF362 domain-containing protein [Planctomycetota bacterium]|jgi:uncharacterized protein (DUF362 family)